MTKEETAKQNTTLLARYKPITVYIVVEDSRRDNADCTSVELGADKRQQSEDCGMQVLLYFLAADVTNNETDVER